MNRNLYELIGVAQYASQEQIESACLQMGEKFRPDKNGLDDVSRAVFAELEKAFAVLSDPVARRAYDAQLLSEGDANQKWDRVEPPGRKPSWLLGVLWTSRSLKSKVLIVLAAIMLLGAIQRIGDTPPERPLPRANIPEAPKQPTVNRVPPQPGSGRVLTNIEASEFSYHAERVADQRPITDLQYRDSLVQSAQITLGIVVKVIDSVPKGLAEQTNCKNRFSETLLTARYIRNFYDTYQRIEVNKSPREVEMAILNALQTSVGCNI